jgi:hypothetical protein
MDNLSLEVLVNEIKARVLDTSIQRVKLAADRTLILALRARVTEYLTISLKPGFPSLCILPEEVPSEPLRSEPLLALRKYLVGGRIVAVRKSLADRVVVLEIENCRLSEQPERFGLVIELIPNRTRACLLDSEQRVQVWLPAAPGLFGTYAPPVMPVAGWIQSGKKSFGSCSNKREMVQDCPFSDSVLGSPGRCSSKASKTRAGLGKRCKHSCSACLAAHIRRESTMLNKSPQPRLRILPDSSEPSR